MSKPETQGIQNRDVNAAQRATLAVSLRAKKLTYEQIAQQCGYGSAGACHKAIMRELQRRAVPNIDELRSEESAMLDQLHAAIWPMAIGEQQQEADDESEEGEKKRRRKGPNLFAVDRVLAISERRARLMGLDMQKDAVAANMVVVREVPTGYLGEAKP